MFYQVEDLIKLLKGKEIINVNKNAINDSPCIFWRRSVFFVQWI